MVGKERLELSRISALASKTSVATITPLALKNGTRGGIRTPDTLRVKQTQLPLCYSRIKNWTHVPVTLWTTRFCRPLHDFSANVRKNGTSPQIRTETKSFGDFCATVTPMT